MVSPITTYPKQSVEQLSACLKPEEPKHLHNYLQREIYEMNYSFCGCRTPEDSPIGIIRLQKPQQKPQL